jgi:hypothetical protein
MKVNQKAQKLSLLCIFFSPNTDGKYFDVSSLTNLYNSKHIHYSWHLCKLLQQIYTRVI